MSSGAERKRERTIAFVRRTYSEYTWRQITLGEQGAIAQQDRIIAEIKSMDEAELDFCIEAIRWRLRWLREDAMQSAAHRN